MLYTFIGALSKFDARKPQGMNYGKPYRLSTNPVMVFRLELQLVALVSHAACERLYWQLLTRQYHSFQGTRSSWQVRLSFGSWESWVHVVYLQNRCNLSTHRSRLAPKSLSAALYCGFDRNGLVELSG